MVILDMGAGKTLISKHFIMTPWTSLSRTVKASRLWSASNSPMEVPAYLSLPLQIVQRHGIVEFLVVPGSAMNMLLGSAFISRYTEKISPKAGTIRSVRSTLAAIAVATEESPPKAVENDKRREPIEVPCGTARSNRLLPTIKLSYESSRQLGDSSSRELRQLSRQTSDAGGRRHCIHSPRDSF